MKAYELRVLKLIAQGYRAREAAAELKISTRTVEKYLDNMKHYLEAKNTPHLIHIAHKEKILS